MKEGKHEDILSNHFAFSFSVGQKWTGIIPSVLLAMIIFAISPVNTCFIN